jgi:hypothetical protein
VRSSGLVMLIAGVWIGCQLWGGDALQRLKIVAS